ncbi:MAG: murein hydrolase activator EnvC family protein [Acidimicrobiales bacterium]
MTTTRIRALVLIVVLVMLMPARALAQSSEDKAAKKAAAAAQLDALKADDVKLAAAVRTLDAGIVEQSGVTDAARRAANAADAAVDSAQARLAATEKKMANLKQKATEVAVMAYVHPSGDSIIELMKARDLAEASRRQTLLSQVVQVDHDVLGQLRAVRQDQQSEQANLLVLRDQAQQRRKDATDKLNQLQSLRDDQVRLKSALDVRIAQFTAEVNALAREESNIANLIRAREVTGASVDGNPVPARSASGLIWPVPGNVSSSFGWRWGAMHSGIDIDSGPGVPIKAAKTGTVIMAGWNGGYGNCVVIDHGGGFSTLYAHQASMSVGSGQSVSQGQVIGYVGGTGNVTGPHLHFETRVGGAAQNPLNFLP